MFKCIHIFNFIFDKDIKKNNKNHFYMNLIYIFVKILNLKTMESNNLNECLEYAKDSGDFEPIEWAVIEQTKIIEKAVQQLLELKKTLLSNQNPIL